jgi:hypothetical protein
LLSLVALSGCAAQVWPNAPESGLPPRASSDSPRPPFDVQSAARALARLRGLELREPIQVEELDVGAFRDRRASTDAAGRRAPRDGDSGALWTAFAFAAPRTNIAAVAKSLYDELVAGFYDAREKKLYVPKGVVALESSRNALMHEIEHALQDQNFGMPDRATPRDDDSALALKSLYEGDATLASLAFHADAATPPSRAWLVRVARAFRARPIDEFIDQGGAGSKVLLAAPALLRMRLMSPYLDGTAFVADVYRAGGFALINQVFAHPPMSTEHVLHPEKYVEGDLPVLVASPTAPAGHRLVTSGRLGELQLSVFLAQCGTAEDAKRNAAGWGGDAYAIIADDAQKLGVLLATAWDDEEAATRFASALDARRACLAKQSADGAALAETIAVRRDNTHVAYVHGLDARSREAALVQLLSLPGAAPALAPPVGVVTIPISAVPEDFIAKGATSADGRFESKPLGVTFVVPRGKLSEPSRGTSRRANGLASRDVDWRMVSGQEAERLEEALSRELSAEHPLVGRAAHAVARRDDCDDVAYEIEPGGLCVVHLTYGEEKKSRWPTFSFVETLPEDL